MKYIVLHMINPQIDACSFHPSGVATCSDGNAGFVWTFKEDGLFDSKDEANAVAKELYKKRRAYYFDNYALPTEWEFNTDDIYTAINLEHTVDDGFEIEWLEKWEVVGIKEL